MRHDRGSRGAYGSPIAVESAVSNVESIMQTVQVLISNRYGVARVYAQQCGYVLTDAESARNNLRAMSRVIKQAELGPEGANKAR